MTLIDRYIGVTIVRSTVLVLSVLLALFTFFTFADELNKTGEGNYDTLGALQYALLTIPRMVNQLFPVAALLGTLIGLGALANNAELTAMRASGVTLNRIIRAVVKFGFALIVVSVVLGEWVAPIAERMAEQQRSLAFNQGNALQTDHRLWMREGKTFINLKDIQVGGQLGQVNIFEIGGDHRLAVVTQAEKALLQQDNSWQLENVINHYISWASIQTEQLPVQTKKVLLSHSLIDVITVKPESMSSLVLYRYAQYLVKNGVDAQKYIQALWANIMAPVNTLVMVLLALPFVFGSLRSVSTGQRVLVGTLIGVGFYIFSQMFNYLGLVYHINPVIATTLPTVSCFIIAIYFIRRIH